MLQKIIKKIHGLAEGQIHWGYDSESDVLYSKIKDAKYPYELILDGGIVLSVDPEKYEVIGFTIIDYKWRIEHNKLGAIPFFSKEQLPQYPEIFDTI